MENPAQYKAAGGGDVHMRFLVVPGGESYKNCSTGLGLHGFVIPR